MKQPDGQYRLYSRCGGMWLAAGPRHFKGGYPPWEIKWVHPTLKAAMEDAEKLEDYLNESR